MIWALLAMLGWPAGVVQGRAPAPDPILRYVLCEDLDCVEALQAVKSCAGKCVPRLLEILATGLPRDADPRSPEFARAKAAEALGEIRDRRSLAPLKKTLTESSAVLRAASARALGRLGGREALASLRAARQSESDVHVRATIDAAIKSAEPR